MNKFIIENKTDLDDEQVFLLVSNVIKEGRISNNNQYCYFTIFKYNDVEYGISTFLNKKSDRFVIYKTK